MSWRTKNFASLAFFLVGFLSLGFCSESLVGRKSNSSFYIKKSPKPARVYANAPSGLAVTQVVYSRKLNDQESPEGEVFYSDTEYTTEEGVANEYLQVAQCFPHYYLFSSQNESQAFTIDICDGTISSASYVAKPVGFVYSLLIVVKDSTNATTLANSSIDITVTEFNADTPALTRQYYSLEIIENAKIGAILSTVSAIDKDDKSYNRELYFFLQNHSFEHLDPLLFSLTSPFSIDVLTGEIKLTSSLLNVSSPLNLQIGVTDGGSPRRTHSSKMVVYIRKMSAPRNVKIVNTTETSITVCWSPPIQGDPEGYMISYELKSNNAANGILEGQFNITKLDLERGAAGFLYDSLVGDNERVTTIFPDEIGDIFSPDFCAFVPGLHPYSVYSVRVRGWAGDKMSMSRVPIRVTAKNRSCFGDTCVDGVCQETDASPGYSCRCKEESYGPRCEFRRICNQNDDCRNGGTCKRVKGSRYGHVCSCLDGYVGPNCEKIDGCFPDNPCQNHGTCLFNGNKSHCVCLPRYSGERCEKINPEAFRAVCAPDTLVTDKGNFSWPVTFKDETAALPCPINSLQSTNSARDKRSVVYFGKVLPEIVSDDLDILSRWTRSISTSVLTSSMTTSFPAVTSDSSGGATFNAFRDCKTDSAGVTRWLPPDLSQCISVDSEIPEEELVVLHEPETLTSDIVTSSARHLSQRMERVLNNRTAARQFVKALSNLLRANYSTFESTNDRTSNASEAIFNAINSYTAKVHLEPGQDIKLSSNNLVLEAKMISKNDLPEEVSFYPYKDVQPSDVNSSENLIKNVFVKIPRVALTNVESENIRLEFISYKDDRIYQNGREVFLKMPVIVAKISNVQVCNLRSPVTYHIPISEHEWKTRKPTCVYWDDPTRSWATNGLTTRIQSNKELICESNHLTAFSVLLDPIGLPPASHDQVLSIITFVLLFISTIALIITILTFVMFRFLNRDRSGVIVVNLSMALVLLNFSFLASTLTSIDFQRLCYAAGAFVHYSMIASFAWMLIEAQNMFQLLVTVFPSSETHFLFKRLFFGWGFPFLLISMTILWDRNVYVNKAARYCFINPHENTTLYYSAYAVPIGLVLCLNIFVFIRVAVILCQRRPRQARNSQSSPNRPSHKSPPVTVGQIKGAIAIVALLGITWVLGFFAIDSMRTVFQFLFCLTTPLQGFIIFLVRVVQSAEARVAWKSFLKTGSVRKRQPWQVSSARTHSSNQNSSSMNTSLTGVTPTSLFASAIRRLSNGTSISNGGSHRRSSNGSIFYTANVKSPAPLQEKIPISSTNSSFNRNSSYKAQDSYQTKEVIHEKGPCTIYESKFEGEPLKDLQVMFCDGKLFDKMDFSDCIDKDSSINRDLIIDLDSEFQQAINSCIDNEQNNNRLLNQMNVLYQRNISSMLDLSPHQGIYIDRNNVLNRSMDSLLPKSSASDCSPVRLNLDVKDTSIDDGVESAENMMADFSPILSQEVPTAKDALLLAATDRPKVSLYRPNSCLTISTIRRDDLPSGRARSVEGLHIFPDADE